MHKVDSLYLDAAFSVEETICHSSMLLGQAQLTAGIPN